MDRQIGQRNETVSPEIDPYVEDNLISIKCATTLQYMSRGGSGHFNNGAGANRCPHGKKKSLDLHLIPYTKINST